MLPKGWTWVKLGRMGKLTQGGTPSTDVAEFWNGKIPFITGADVTNLFVANARSYLTSRGIDSGKTQKCEEGDLLIVSRTRVGRIGIAATTLGISQDVSAIKLKERYHNKYIAIYLSSLPKYLQESSQGAIIKGLTRGFLENLEIPVPPTIDDQFTIANKLEKRAINIEEMRRAALLQKEAAEAMSGAILRELFSFKDGERLPQGWKWAKTVDVLDNSLKSPIRMGPFGSQLTKDELVSDGVFVLGIEHVLNNKFDDSGYKFITNEKFQQLKGFQVRPGDVLMTMMGTIGRTAVVPEGMRPTIISSHLLKMTLRKDVYPDYIAWVLSNLSPAYRQVHAESQGAIMQGLNTGIIKKLVFPLPSNFDEQAAIVRTLERKMTNVEKLRMTARQQLEAIEAMPAAMLREVFDFNAETGAAI
jgi:type I restriction enzyme S subunit